MVRIHPDPPLTSRQRVEARGAVAQLGEHLLCKQGVVGSIPSSSTIELGIGPRGWRRSAQNPEASGTRLFAMLFASGFTETSSYRLFFNNTEEVKQSCSTGRTEDEFVFSPARGAGWVRLY